MLLIRTLFSTSLLACLVACKLWGEEGGGVVRFRDFGCGYALCPYHAVDVFQLLEKLRGILGVVLVYYDLYFLVPFGLGDWSSGED